MFTSHFKMARQPFLERAPSDAILRDERLAEGLARLKYFAEAGTIGLVTGQTGVGKSSLVRLFVHSQSPNRYQPVYLSLTHVETAGSLLKLLVASLGETPRRGKERLFLQILEKVFEEGAKRLLHDYASGVPRQINSYATACLLNAAARNLQKISEELVNETASEFRLP